MSFILYSTKSSQTLKQLRIQMESNYANYHHVGDSTFLFYHESKTDIEIRSINSLKKRWSLDLTQICNKFNLLHLDQIKVSLDLDFISHLGKLVLMLANKLILSEKYSSDQADLLFDCSDLSIKERLNALRYESEQRVLLVSGVTSFFLFGFDDAGLSYSRHIACNRFGRAIRLLGWNPKEEFIVIAQRTIGEQESYHLIDYAASDPTFVSFLKGQTIMGTFYDPTSNWLFYIEVDDRRKNVRIVDLKGFKEKYELDGQQKEYEIEFDTEHYMSFASNTRSFYLLFNTLSQRHIIFQAFKGHRRKGFKRSSSPIIKWKLVIINIS